MTRIKLEKRRPWRGAARLAAASFVIAGTGGVFGCLDRPIAPNDPRTTSTIVEKLTQSAVDKIDILLAIDNSGSMADKQDILAKAVPDLVEGLVNPRCIDPTGQQMPVFASDPEADCPAGMDREFDPVLDIHIGIISSSLGGHGANLCPKSQSVSNEDMGRLLARSDENSDRNDIPTYQGKGFLAWDPGQKLPAGNAPEEDSEADIEDDSTKDDNSSGLVPRLTEMVKGVGQSGCGFEAQLESVYRFLVDPDPYATIRVEGGRVVTEGTDEVVINQRKDFLRPNSLLAIILLSDENDCSIREESIYYVAAQTRTPNNTPFNMWRPRTECATDANDKCCASCKQDTPDGCPEDPTCKNPDGTIRSLSDDEDPVNHRCWDQKRRFGFDALYPIDRYTKAFRDATVIDRRGNKVPNPLFSDLDPQDDNANIRDAGLVFFAGIVGVPWQNIARQDANGVPDLERGLDAEGNPVGGFKNANELRAPAGGFESVWDVILGDPETNTKPGDPHMHELDVPRTGQNPITGDAIAGVDAADDANPINGHEWTIEKKKGDLQYACVFPLQTERDCTVEETCDCAEVNPTDGAPENNNPLCAETPAGDRTRQVKAKAYPGLRELQLIKTLGSQGIVGSVCPQQLDNPDAPTFGYRPAIGAIIERLKTALGGQCLPRTLTPDDKGQVSCLILEARKADGECRCDDYPARAAVQETHKAAEGAILNPTNEEDKRLVEAAGWNCVCEVQQLEGDALTACQQTVPPAKVVVGSDEVHGWCYIDATIPVGDPQIVAKCPKTEQRLIQFANQGEARLGATLFITCSGE